MLRRELTELFIFTDTFAEDQISLMLQNSRQIRNIVKETAAIDLESDPRSECEQPEPEEVLSCMWSRVSKISKAGSHPYTVDTIQFLTQVG